MATISSLPALYYAAHAYAIITTGFGINACFRPAHALSMFEFVPPKDAKDRAMVDSLMVIYGVRDIFVGAAIWAAALAGTKEALGWTLLSFGTVAFLDGVVCFQHGKGHWTHWGYAPIVVATGCALIGMLDRT
jgi:hypothetical protein